MYHGKMALICIIPKGTSYVSNQKGLHLFILYIDVIISYSIMTLGSPGEKRAEKRGVLGTAIFFVIFAVIG